MIQLVPQLTILLAVEPVDFRKQIDTLAAVCRTQLAADPLSGALFVFRNRSGTALKMLVFDGGGYWLIIKRFSQGKISWWPTSQTAAPLHPLAAHQLAVLLSHGDPERAAFKAQWRKLSSSP